MKNELIAFFDSFFYFISFLIRRKAVHLSNVSITILEFNKSVHTNNEFLLKKKQVWEDIRVFACFKWSFGMWYMCNNLCHLFHSIYFLFNWLANTYRRETICGKPQIFLIRITPVLINNYSIHTFINNSVQFVIKDLQSHTI